MLQSEERLADAKEIESLLAKEGLIQRPSVRLHLEALVQKVKRDANALKKVEASQKKLQEASIEETNDDPEKESPSVEHAEEPTKPTPALPTPAAQASIAKSPSLKYIPIDKFSFDAGGYNSPTVTIYIPIADIGQHSKEKIACKFTKTSFDLTISEFTDKNYRLLNDNLEHEIDPDQSKMKIRANKIILKLQKTKSDYGTYDTWNNLSSKKKKEEKKRNTDPQSSIMDLMKEMYDSGDDNMKKMIGETMMKQREGKLNGPPGGDGLGDMNF